MTKLHKLLHQAAFQYYDPTLSYEYQTNIIKITLNFPLTKIRQQAALESQKLEKELQTIPESQHDSPVEQRIIFALHWLHQMEKINLTTDIPQISPNNQPQHIESHDQFDQRHKLKKIIFPLRKNNKYVRI